MSASANAFTDVYANLSYSNPCQLFCNSTFKDCCANSNPEFDMVA